MSASSTGQRGDNAGTSIRCSVGVMAYNEEKNVGRLLERLLDQELRGVAVTEIIVVASGCTDGTEEVVRGVMERSGKVRLVVEAERGGKASAIQRFLDLAAEDILVMVSADTLPERDAVELLVGAFADARVGMTGARPVPVSPDGGFCGAAVRFFWEMHHRAALRSPKCGEMVAFRKVTGTIPRDVVVDEPYVAAQVERAGLAVRYVPEAVVYNSGPSKAAEILSRRRNIVAGYFHLAARHGIRRRPAHRLHVAAFVLRKMLSPRARPHWVAAAAALELLARFLGWLDFRFSRKPLHVWRPAATTRELPPDAGNAQRGKERREC
ncbi:MAG: glycosyltransferase [bacterium]